MPLHPKLLLQGHIFNDLKYHIDSSSDAVSLFSNGHIIEEKNGFSHQKEIVSHQKEMVQGY